MIWLEWALAADHAEQAADAQRDQHRQAVRARQPQQQPRPPAAGGPAGWR